MYLSRTRHPEDTQFHHVVPRQVYTGTLSRLSEEQRERTLEVRSFLNDLGYTKQSTDNLGLYLPKYESSYDTDRSTHRGYSSNHQQYNLDLVDRMKEVSDFSRDEAYTKEQTKELVDQTLAEMRQDIRTGDINVGPALTSSEGPEGVELDRTKIVGLEPSSILEIAVQNCSTYLGAARVKELAHEIYQMIGNGDTPWVSLSRIKNRYLVVESASHDTFINQAFLKLDYEMKMCCSGASLMLPYDLITEERVQAHCDILDALEANELTVPDAYKRLKAIGFVRVGKNPAYSQAWSDKGDYQLNEYPQLVRERGLENMKFTRLCIKGRLTELRQHTASRKVMEPSYIYFMKSERPPLLTHTLEERAHTFLMPECSTYIEKEDIFSNGRLYQTSDDTKHLKSIFNYLKSCEHLKEAFAVVEWVAILFPLIEQLIREGKEIPFSPDRSYNPPKTPRRVTSAIMNDFEKKGMPIFGGCSLSSQTIVVKNIPCFSWLAHTTLEKFDWNRRHGTIPALRLKRLTQSEKKMYELAISLSKKCSQCDLKSTVDPAFFQDLVREKARQLCYEDFTWEYLGLYVYLNLYEGFFTKGQYQ